MPLRNKFSCALKLRRTANVFIASKLIYIKHILEQNPKGQGHAMSQVFSTTELLEYILLYLGTVDLLFCQQVNKKFRDTVRSSLKLERNLFLRPLDYSPVHHTPISICNPLSKRNPKYLCNPLLDCKRITDVPLKFRGSTFTITNSLEYRGKTVDLHNPCIAGNAYSNNIRVEIVLKEVPVKGNKTKKRHVSSTGSWKDMYLSQPVLPIAVSIYRRDGCWEVLEFSEGMTLGELLDQEDSPKLTVGKRIRAPDAERRWREGTGGGT